VLLGYVDKKGVRTGAVGPAKDEARGLRSTAGGSFRGKAWALVDVQIVNSAGQQPWTPQEATFTSRRGATVRARVVTVGGGEVAPGGSLRVLAVADTVPASAGEVFALEVSGSGGRSLVIPDVGFTEGDR
jgi:uncharacterized protein (TIGR02268 family)